MIFIYRVTAKLFAKYLAQFTFYYRFSAMKMFKWKLEIEVSESWVADGFELTQQRAKDIIESAIPYSSSEETTVKILKAPTQDSIRKAQGY